MSGTNPSTAVRTLEERLEAFAEALKPKPGDKLIGRVVDVDLRESDYGDPYPIVTVATDAGPELAFHGFHTVARRELAKKQPQVGDRVGIAYFGKGEPAKPGMSGAELYRIVLERDEKAPAIDWQSIGVVADAQAIAEAINDTPTAPDDGIPF